LLWPHRDRWLAESFAFGSNTVAALQLRCGPFASAAQVEGAAERSMTANPDPIDQSFTFGRSATLTSPSWLVKVSVRSVLCACATPKIR
jgi:hypothetical protein